MVYLQDEETKEEKFFCDICCAPLKEENIVWLAFRTSNSKYYRPNDPFVDEWFHTDDNQGLFSFGPDCAKRLLANQ